MKNEEAGEQAGPTQSRAVATIGESVTTKCIVVNGRSHVHTGDSINTRDLVRLAFPDAERIERYALTVAYDGGPREAHAGLLGGNASTPVIEGQKFSVSLTDKS